MTIYHVMEALGDKHIIEGFSSGVASLDEWLVRRARTNQVTLAAADAIEIRMLLVNAIDDRAAGFYRRFGLEPSPTNPLDLMITVNDLSEDGSRSGHAVPVGRSRNRASSVCFSPL